MSQGEGNGPGLAIWWRLAVKEWVIVRVAVVWECGGDSVVSGGKPGDSRNRHPSTRATMSRWPKGPRSGGGGRG